MNCWSRTFVLGHVGKPVVGQDVVRCPGQHRSDHRRGIDDPDRRRRPDIRQRRMFTQSADQAPDRLTDSAVSNDYVEASIHDTPCDFHRRNLSHPEGRAALKPAAAVSFSPRSAAPRRAAPCSPQPAQAAYCDAEEKPVTAFILGGAWKRAIIEAAGNPFTQKTSIPMRYQDPYNWPKLRAMHEAKAQQMDCASVQGTEVIQAGRIGMAAPLDWSVIDRSALAPRQLARPYAIGGYSLSMVLCYNTNTWPGDDRPKSWADFWNVDKFPGRRAMRRDAQWTIEVAASVERDKDAPRYPIDLERAFKNSRSHQASREDLVVRQFASPGADGAPGG